MTNNTNTELLVWIEPWAFDISIPPGGTAIFRADSEIDGEFELHERDGVTEIYGWGGSSLVIELNGEEIYRFEDNRVPIMNNGMSSKDFVDLVFYPKPKKWWQFWR